ncbi:MAG TPA: hypothetical protein VIJ83_05360, partial [Solirubrobacteraceae bacterium]
MSMRGVALLALCGGAVAMAPTVATADAAARHHGKHALSSHHHPKAKPKVKSSPDPEGTGGSTYDSSVTAAGQSNVST